jgi:hypothetical protein
VVTFKIVTMSLLLLFWATSACPQNEQNASSPMVEDIDAVQEVLGSADVPLTRLQLQEILGGAGSSQGKGKPFGPMLAGYAGWRHQWDRKMGSAWTSRMNFKGNSFNMRLKHTKGNTGVSETAGFMVFEKLHLKMGLGDFGMNHGFGLLKAGPGRGAYLGSDNKFGMKRQGIRPWSGGVDSGALRGGSLQWCKGGKWDVSFVMGQVNGVDKDPLLPKPVEKMLRLGGHDEGKKWGFLMASSGTDMGFSIAGSSVGSMAHASFEVAGWRAGQVQTIAAFAWALVVGMEPWNNWVTEGVLVATDGTGFFTGGQLPYLPAGEGGRGWFLRGGRKVPGVGHVMLLVGKMKHRTTTGTGQRHNTILLDLQGRWLPRKGLEINARWRRRHRVTEMWSAIYPWQAPFNSGQELRSVLSGQIKWKSGPMTTKFMARHYQQGKDETWGVRSLVSVAAIYRVGKNLAIQGSNTTAWGDPIDLVSALSPMAGLVLPRHWGNWREETTIGIRLSWKKCQVRSGFSLRLPESWHFEKTNTSFWGECQLRW